MLGVVSSMRICLVEDERSLNVLLEKYLQIEGYEVTTFFDGNSAMEAMTKRLQKYM